MIKSILLKGSRRLVMSLALSAAILSIANVDSLWRESQHSEDLAQARKEKSRAILAQRLNDSTQNKKSQKSVNLIAQELRQSLMQDEIADLNPFSSLESVDSLASILNSDIKNFDRQTYRSSKYQGEAGYDVVHYDLLHGNGDHSSVISYVEQDLVDGTLHVIVALLRTEGGRSHYSLFRSGRQIEAREISIEDSQSLVAQRLNSAIPFLSVSR